MTEKKKRKLNKKAKISMNIFMGMTILLIGLFVYVATFALNVEAKEIPISQGSIVYDDTDSKYVVETNGVIKPDILGGYELVEEDGRKIYLGKNTVANVDGTIYLLGGGYQIGSDGGTVKIESEHEITDLNTIGIYKLADRKYFFSGGIFTDTEESFTTSGSVYLVLDTMGNAMISNEQMTIKTVKPTTLVFGEYEFKIATEELISGDKTIALKDIIGSTNIFNELLYKDIDDEQREDSIDIESVGGDGGTGGLGGDGGTAGTAGSGGTGGLGGQGGNGSLGEQVDVVKQILIKGVTKKTTALNVSYYASDPFGQYGIIYLALYDADANVNDSSESMLKSQAVNVYDNSYTFSGLKPNTQYQVVIGHVIEDSGMDVYNVDDIVKTTTSQPDNSISINKQDSNNLSAQICLDSYYSSDDISVILRKYNGAVGTSSTPMYINSSSLFTSSGYTLNINYTNMGITWIGESEQLELVVYADGDVVESLRFNNAYYGKQ